MMQENFYKIQSETLLNTIHHAENEIDLSDLHLKEIPCEIFEKEKLAVLNLQNNEIAKIPPDIKRLENLRVLNLMSNNIVELPQEIGQLHKLRVLLLGGNKLYRLPKEIRYLHNLKKLTLGGNPFQSFPKIIRQLKSLRFLDLKSNNIRELPSNIKKLEKLCKIDLSYTNLKRLPAEIAELKNLEQIVLLGVVLETPPPEIIDRGIQAIRNYFSELTTDVDYLYEIKLLLVGEGGVGKTSLAKTLSIPNYVLENEQSTEGIDISQWTISKEEFGLTRDFRINIWDFGGQELYHSTHQFFFTKRSVYVLVTESRKEDKHEDFYYWLNIIKLLGGSSPVIIVLNKCEQPTKELPINEYKQIFTSIVDFKKVSCKPCYKDTIDALKAELKRILTNSNLLPHIGTPLPKVWVDIRMELEKAKKKGYDYITYDEYLSICRQFDMNEKRALWLSQFFHDLGVTLHFQDDIILRKTVILNHEWVTEGVYNVLDNRTVIENKGVFYDKDLISIWSDKKYKDKHPELLSLMKNEKFEVCFELEPGKYLAPRLLPVDEISYIWSKDNNLCVEYRYKFMPKGILTRFIVKRNKDIYKNTYWRYGVLLENDETRAIIRERYFERKIIIALEGANKREFLGVIRKAFQEIHHDFNNLEVKEMIPCNCKDCTNSQTPHFFEYSELNQYYREGVSHIVCRRNKIKPVDVSSLLKDVNLKKEERIRKYSDEHGLSYERPSINNAQVMVTGGEIIMGNKNIGRDNIEISGNAKVTEFTTGSGDTFQGDYAQKLLQSTTPQSSQDDIVKLLSFVQQELPKLLLSEEAKEEITHEVKGAEIQARKDQPDKQKVAIRLKNATEALKESAVTIKEAVTIGNLLGQAILWCGEQWMKWK